jgi:hypothetical protein
VAVSAGLVTFEANVHLDRSELGRSKRLPDHLLNCIVERADIITLQTVLSIRS